MFSLNSVNSLVILHVREIFHFLLVGPLLLLTESSPNPQPSLVALPGLPPAALSLVLGWSLLGSCSLDKPRSRSPGSLKARLSEALISHSQLSRN